MAEQKTVKEIIVKTRNGFVSNSSSASFIIQWRINGPVDTGENINSALRLLFDMSREDTVSDIFMDIGQERFSYQHFFDYIENRSKEISKGTFETTFFTVMMNTMADFGPEALLLLSSLEMNFEQQGVRNFEIIHKTIDCDS